LSKALQMHLVRIVASQCEQLFVGAAFANSPILDEIADVDGHINVHIESVDGSDTYMRSAFLIVESRCAIAIVDLPVAA
jgi:hypothetical protein